MNKDPAFLFYSSDFLVGTMLMNYEEIGKYIKLLAYIHTKGGSITEKEFYQVCNKDDVVIIEKFKVDGEGNYYNERLLSEIRKRSNYTESRRNNRLKATDDDLFVYLILNKTNGLTKIGSSNNPERRLIELKNQNKECELEMIANIGGVSNKLEKKLHKEFKRKNKFNEWFELSKEDIDLIIFKNHMIIHMNNHMSTHMENENEIININNKSLSLKENNNNEDINKVDYIQVVSYLNQKSNKNFRVTEATKKLINARIKEGFTIENFYTVIDNQCEKWLSDENMVDYLRPQTLFSTKFESYLNTIKKKKFNIMDL